MKKAGLSNPLDAARAVSRLEAELSALGMQAHTSTNFDDLSALKLRLRGSLPSPMHDGNVCVFTQERAFWMSLTNSTGETVAIQAFRFDDIDTPLADWVLSYMVGVYMRRQELLVPSHPHPPQGSLSERLTGKLVYHGELWIDKAVKNRKVFENFMKLGLILCLIKWHPDAIWAAATPQMAGHGHLTRGGYAVLERGFLRWQWSTDSIGPMEYLVASDRNALEQLVNEMLAPDSSIVPVSDMGGTNSRSASPE
jgi:hypothetical protein